MLYELCYSRSFQFLIYQFTFSSIYDLSTYKFPLCLERTALESDYQY